MDEADIFLSRLFPHWKLSFLKEVGWVGAQKILKFKLEKSCFTVTTGLEVVKSISFGSCS